MPVTIEQYTLTIAEAAKLLGGSEKAIQRLIFTAKLDAIRVKGDTGHEFRICPDELRAQQAVLRRLVEEIDADAKPQRRTETGGAEAGTEGGRSADLGRQRSKHGEPSRARSEWGRSASEPLPLGFGLPDEPAVLDLVEEEQPSAQPPFVSADSGATVASPVETEGSSESLVGAASATEESIESLVGAVSALVDGSGGEASAEEAPADSADPFVAITIAPLPTLDLESEPKSTAWDDDEEWVPASSGAVAVAASAVPAEFKPALRTETATARPSATPRIVELEWDDEPLPAPEKSTSAQAATPTAIEWPTEKPGLFERLRRLVGMGRR